MVHKIMCPNCHEMNECINKFCIYCAHELDVPTERIINHSQPYCLNCGRFVNENQIKCSCGYEFNVIDCPKCNAKNAYANKFCTDCGEKLWTSEVREIKYGWLSFPQDLRNTIAYSRHKQISSSHPPDWWAIFNEQEFQLNISRLDDNLSEVLSRWKIVSPDNCISCLSKMKADEYRCKNCGTAFPDVVVDYVKNKKYKKPVFDREELKWSSKLSENYLDSLAPDIGESQLEYRERLKWEFQENRALLEKINSIKRELQRKREIEEFIRQHGGYYCGPSCRHYYEVFITADGVNADPVPGFFGSQCYCSLGRTIFEGWICPNYKY